MSILEYIIMGAIGSFSNIFLWSRILSKKMNFKNTKFLSIFIVLSGLLLVNYFFVNKNIRILLITIIFCISIKELFNTNLKQSIIVTMYSQFLSIICETFFALLTIGFQKLTSIEIVLEKIGTFLPNFIISLLLIFVALFKFHKRIYNYLLRVTEKIKIYNIIILVVIVIIFVNILMISIYYNSNLYYLISISSLLLAFCFIIILYSLIIKNNYLKVSDKYNMTLNSLKEYEDMLDKYRIINHENKNQLLTIRNMVHKNNRKTLSYIDEIISNKLKDNNEIMSIISVIPSGGLRGLIYSKILIMQNLNIDYKLLFSKKIKATTIIKKIDDSTMLDICQIIGVYIDNAIDAVSVIDEKHINIEIYMENQKLVIEISNNIKEKIDLDKIDNIGYTTKENGHGYGLSLAKRTIEKNSVLSHESRISKNIFTQVLKIDTIK